MKDLWSTRSSFSNDWIAIPRPARSPRVRLLCFPHGGGSAHAFYSWPAALPKDVEMCAVQLPGRGRRLLDAAPTSIDQLIEPLWEAFQPLREMPVAFFGHSLGATIAFEFARHLQSKGIHLVHLFVSGATAPQLPDRDPPICHLPDPEFIAEVRRRYEGFAEEILRDDGMMAMCLPALRADFTINETYRYADGPPLQCPISAFGGDLDGSVTVYDLAAWRQRTGGAFSSRIFPGGHFFVESDRDSVLRHVVADLDRSLRGSLCESVSRVGA